MMAAPRWRTADDVLRRLSALGARVECRGDKIVLRIGARPVPPDLIAAAREAKVELSKMLNPPKMLNSGKGEHLRRVEAENPSFSAASIEGAQPSENEHLRADLSTFDESEGSRTVPGHPAAKVLTEDAHLSTFDEGEDFCGFQRDPAPKVLNPAHASAFGRNERLRQSWGEAEEERGAIIEHDGKIPREWAEGFARLNPDRAPGDVPLRRWQRFVDDVGLFLDSPFCTVAAALGWGPYDLFGCDRDRPYARLDGGLLWRLDGAKLAALSENTATIKALSGATHTFRRKPAVPGQVLAWELASSPAAFRVEVSR